MQDMVVLSIPGWERYSGGGNGHPLQYSCMGNPMDRGAWRATGHKEKSDTTEHAHTRRNSETLCDSIYTTILQPQGNFTYGN